ncbi:MAG: hypothetical protein M3O15_05390 [Acidobacteriota bacterium]|nr:hypothetical protein [Acidobacteriota bacterium]
MDEIVSRGGADVTFRRVSALKIRAVASRPRGLGTKAPGGLGAVGAVVARSWTTAMEAIEAIGSERNEAG